MLLTSAQVDACVIAPPNFAMLRQARVSVIVASDPAVRTRSAHLLTLRRNMRVEIGPTSEPPADRAYIVYAYDEGEQSRLPEVVVATAGELQDLAGGIRHLNISDLDVGADEIAHSLSAMDLRSVDASRLDLDDETVRALAKVWTLPHLRWLNLSGNPRVGVRSIEAIASSVGDGRLRHLEWLDLLGTDFDATPYVDGYYWRITEEARQIARSYGYQRWMMLGSRIAAMAGIEPLTTKQRRLPPNRFRRF